MKVKSTPQKLLTENCKLRSSSSGGSKSKKIEDMSFDERFSYYSRKVANDNGYNNLGEMAASAMRNNQTCGAGAGPAMTAYILTGLSYLKY